MYTGRSCPLAAFAENASRTAALMCHLTTRQASRPVVQRLTGALYASSCYAPAFRVSQTKLDGSCASEQGALGDVHLQRLLICVVDPQVYQHKLRLSQPAARPPSRSPDQTAHQVRMVLQLQQISATHQWCMVLHTTRSRCPGSSDSMLIEGSSYLEHALVSVGFLAYGIFCCAVMTAGGALRSSAGSSRS